MTISKKKINENSPKARIGGASLDILRFIASNFILLFHFYNEWKYKIKSLEPIMSKGWIGTDLFIALSGVVMSRAYGQALASRKISIRKFMFKRYLRLIPSHLIALFAFGAIFLLIKLMGISPNHIETFSGFGFTIQSVLVHAWGFNDIPSWNIPTWTISALLICYFIYAILIPFFFNMKISNLFIFGIIILFIANYISINIAKLSFVDLPLKWALLRAIPIFFLGVIAERMSKNLFVYKLQFYWLEVLIFLAIITLCYFPKNLFSDNIILLLLISMVTIASRTNFNETQFTRILGRSSYSLFLIHTPIQIFGNRYIKIIVEKYSLNIETHFILWSSLILFSIICSFIFEKHIDRPLAIKTTKIVNKIK